jgi:hypothetical protein
MGVLQFAFVPHFKDLVMILWIGSSRLIAAFKARPVLFRESFAFLEKRV